MSTVLHVNIYKIIMHLLASLPVRRTGTACEVASPRSRIWLALRAQYQFMDFPRFRGFEATRGTIKN